MSRQPLAFTLALRELRGARRGFGIFLACLAVGVMAIAGIGSFARALTEGLEREGRAELARACFDFLPTRSRLDLAGWDEIDIFAHA